MIGSHFEVLPLVPFSADVVEEFTHDLGDGNVIHQETHGRFWRDSEARTRRETELVTVPGDKHQQIAINDPVDRVGIMLNPENKTAMVTTHMPPAFIPVDPAERKPVTEPKHHIRRPDFEELGTKEMEGYTVIGTRQTRTIEAGAMGNQEPIRMITENWYAPELHADLLTILDDPQSGRRETRLINIHRGEPDELLFQAPPDYEVRTLPTVQFDDKAKPNQ